MGKSRISSIELVLLALCTAGAPALAAIADAERSRVEFIAKQSDVPLTGRFNQFTANVDIDPDHPTEGTIDVVLALASVDAGGADANNLLKSKEFFDVTRFPNASFVAQSIAALGNGRFEARGPFTLKGRSADIVIPFTARRDATGLWFEGATTLSRQRFQVGEGQWSDTGLLDDEVQIQFKLHVVH